MTWGAYLPGIARTVVNCNQNCNRWPATAGAGRAWGRGAGADVIAEPWAPPSPARRAVRLEGHDIIEQSVAGAQCTPRGSRCTPAAHSTSGATVVRRSAPGSGALPQSGPVSAAVGCAPSIGAGVWPVRSPGFWPGAWRLGAMWALPVPVRPGHDGRGEVVARQAARELRDASDDRRTGCRSMHLTIGDALVQVLRWLCHDLRRPGSGGDWLVSGSLPEPGETSR